MLGGGCTSGPARAHAQYLFTQHVALFVDDQGRGGYVLELRSVRTVPALSELTVTFDRPDGPPYERTLTVQAGQRRFELATPVFRGFDPGRDYYVRARLLALDRFTQLDRLRQRVRPTPAGRAAAPED